MDLSETTQKIFNEEAQNALISDIMVRDVKILDQFGPSYDFSISKYRTPKSICGYVVCGVAPILATRIAGENNISTVQSVMKDLNRPQFIVSEVEKPMSFIKEQRQQYVAKYGHEFKTEKAKSSYMTDWVANYEISDYLQIFAPGENVFFLRFCAWDFPELAAKTTHEEKNRIKEELRFKGKRQFVEVFYPKRRLLTLEDFASEKIVEKMFDQNRAVIFVGDLAGHFVTFAGCKMRRGERLQKTILLVDSTPNNYIKQDEVLFNLCKLVFPESIITF